MMIVVCEEFAVNVGLLVNKSNCGEKYGNSKKQYSRGVAKNY